jgi:hypothetical protein
MKMVNPPGFSGIRFIAGLAAHTSISSLPAKIKSLEGSQIMSLRELSIVAAHDGSTFLFTQAANFLFY